MTARHSPEASYKHHLLDEWLEDNYGSDEYCEEYYPERLQNLVDSGEIYRYLEELDIKVTDAVGEQAELLMKNNREYQIANEIGDLYNVCAIGNNCRQEARDMVFAAMVYV